MRNLLSTFVITLLVVGGVALLLNFCRRRLRKTPHGLTGICHKDGGRLCSSCRDQLQAGRGGTGPRAGGRENHEIRRPRRL
ncbi:MAG TPA: hypothetical protein ENN98_04795 [Desulfurivibrio alkaliphilus]|uniref:Uncharacterized protein n=1 Tax=Desulfurivibrio alkaliphilus TaxID=427923 RepID=A0A7C2TGG6_9BACT|nr:hypothetical protein [Desulfurivibrio alkaliphilus]